MTNWTKGRWWIAGRWDGSCYMCMGDMKNGPHKQFDIGLDWDNESDRADAHLIAAAPKLYEALDGIVKELMHDCPSNLKPELRDAISALSKARGEAK